MDTLGSDPPLLLPLRNRIVSALIAMSVQVYDLDTFKVTHASKYPGPVLSLGISPDCGLLAVGQADGQLSIRKHSKPKVVPVEAGKRRHCCDLSITAWGCFWVQRLPL